MGRSEKDVVAIVKLVEVTINFALRYVYRFCYVNVT